MKPLTSLTVAALALLAAAPAAAQRPVIDARGDVEAMARASGRVLPQGYYDRIRRDPGFLRVSATWPSYARTTNGVLSGTLPIVVVQALFSDSPEPAFGAATTQQAIFDGPSANGTLTQFYKEVSGNRLNVTGKVLPWVRTGITRADAVGTAYGLGTDAKLGLYFKSALDHADSLVDFGQFDNDGPDGTPNSGDDNGVVDLVVFQFWEVEASCGGNGIWPHFSGYSGWFGDELPYVTNDPRATGGHIVIDPYITQSARSCSSPTPQTVSAMAHEVGHLIGLPDIYDAVDGILPNQRRWILGCFSLMAGGAWGCGDGSTGTESPRPTHFGPWEKMRKGWIQFQQADPLQPFQSFTLSPVQTSGQGLRIPLRADREFLMIEYRPAAGFDAGLPASGVLVYRYNMDANLYGCDSCPRKYLISLLEADDDSALVKTSAEGGNRGVASDVFTAGKTWFLDASTRPALRLADGTGLGRTLRISVDGGVAHVVWMVDALAVPLSRALQPFLGAGPAPTAEEQAKLDALGNHNGSFDVGDLRTYLRLNPEAASASASRGLPPGVMGNR
jgi:M6 family metalloprotease-like protein